MPSISNISDRHADIHVERWLFLLRDIEVDGFSAGHALKRTFFAHWLKPPQHLRNELPIGRFAHLITSRPVYNVSETSDIILLFHSLSERELINGASLNTFLGMHRFLTVLPDTNRIKSLAGISRILRHRTRFSTLVNNLLSAFRRLQPNLGAIRKHFGLPRSFDRWFWHELERSLWVYANALDILDRGKPKLLISTSDNTPRGYESHKAAHKLGIADLVIQHGFIGQEWLFSPLWAAHICVWGEVEAEWYRRRSISGDRINVTGNPRGLSSLPVTHRSGIRRSLAIDSNQKLVIWFTTPQAGDWLPRLQLWLNNAIWKNPSIKLFLRLHPTERSTTYRQFSADHIKIFEASELALSTALVAADAILHDYSSIGAEASYCGQNVICTEVNPPYPPYYRDLIGPQLLAKSADDLAEFISKLSAPTLQIRSNSCLHTGGESASHAIADVIERLVN